MTETLQERIATAIYENHPVDGTGWTVATAEDIAITVMDVLNDPQLTNKEGTLRDEPVNRMERIVNKMTDCMDAHPEHQDGDKCVVFLSTGTMGGMVAHGYEGNEDTGRMVTAAIVDVLMHLRAMFRSIGKDIDIIALPEIPADLGGLSSQGEQ